MLIFKEVGTSSEANFIHSFSTGSHRWTCQPDHEIQFFLSSPKHPKPQGKTGYEKAIQLGGEDKKREKKLFVELNYKNK